MNSLIKIAVVLAFAAVASGNLPQIISQVRKAQFQLIMESKASNWPKAMRMPSRQQSTCSISRSTARYGYTDFSV